MFSFGLIDIYWYGFFIVLGVLSALLIAVKLGSYLPAQAGYGIKKEIIIDLAFYLVIFGVIGARVYDMFFVEWNYFINNPLDIFKIWQGGLAIHGAVIAGVITLYFFAKKNDLDFWLLASILVPGLALAQAIGRWGNYFNQELFGGPTDLPWGIPIDIMNRPVEYLSSIYFHPAFLYESLGNLLIFTVLIAINFFIIKRGKMSNEFSRLASVSDSESRRTIFNFSARGGSASGGQFSIIVYFVLYSILRFFTEFIRIDPTPEILGLRLPQIVSIFIVILSLSFIVIGAKRSKIAD